MNSEELFQKVQNWLSLMVNLPCWHVGAGTGVGSSFSLSLGGKQLRKYPLKNPLASEVFRKYEGEVSFVAWCTWRLDGQSESLASSDEESEVISEKLTVLVGRTVEAVEITSPAWDLCMSFSGALRLHIFCDHVPGAPSFDGNWQLEVRGTTIGAGPGFKLEIENST